MQSVIRSALIEAEASTVVSLQLHGTGTPLGDPIEAGAALAVLRPKAVASSSQPLDAGMPALVLSAVKSWMGHSEAAAGVMGLLHAQHSLTSTTIQGTHVHKDRLRRIL